MVNFFSALQITLKQCNAGGPLGGPDCRLRLSGLRSQKRFEGDESLFSQSLVLRSHKSAEGAVCVRLMAEFFASDVQLTIVTMTG